MVVTTTAVRNVVRCAPSFVFFWDLTHSCYRGIGAIADLPLAYNEFTRSCAQAGPAYCAIATANSTQADIAAWLQNVMDFAFDHPLGETTSALVRCM